MSRRVIYALVCMFLLCAGRPAQADYKYADGTPYAAKLTFTSERLGRDVTFDNLPKFEDYPAARPVQTTARDIDWTSHPRAWEFRTRLRQGLKAPANFGGAYSVVSHGCGSGCQTHWIIHRASGRVLGIFSTTAGAVFDNNSRLIIANLPDRVADLGDAWGLLGEVVFYAAENNTLKQIQRIDVTNLDKQEAPD